MQRRDRLLERAASSVREIVHLGGGAQGVVEEGSLDLDLKPTHAPVAGGVGTAKQVGVGRPARGGVGITITSKFETVQAGSRCLPHFRPRLPGIPTLLKLRLGLFQRSHPIRARHRTVKGERPEPTQMIGTASHLVDAADVPPSGVDRVILPVLVDPRTEARRAKFQSQ